MNKLSYANRFYFLLSAASVVILAIFILFVFPLYTKVIAFKKSTYEQRVQLAIYEQLRLNADETRRDYNTIKSSLDNISKIFVNKEKILDFISTLENVATTTNMQQNIAIDNDSMQSGDKINLKINLTGSWQNTFRYLLTIEQLDYYIVINQIKVDAQSDELSSSLTCYVYSLPI